MHIYILYKLINFSVHIDYISFLYFKYFTFLNYNLDVVYNIPMQNIFRSISVYTNQFKY